MRRSVSNTDTRALSLPACAGAVCVLLTVGCGDAAGPSLPTLRIVTDSLPRALPGVAYAQPLEAFGGDQEYEWSLVGTAGGLPSGLTLTAAGEVIGIPTATGAFPFTVRVASRDGQSAARPLSILVPPVLEPHESCGDYPAHAIVTFEDAALAPSVRWRAEYHLGLDPQSDLTCEVVAQLPQLGNGSSNVQIASLVGLQNLTGLTELAFGDAVSIADVGPLATLEALTYLHLGSNSIVDISPLAGLTNLRLLSLRDNMVSDVTPLAGLVNLEILRLGRGAYSYVQMFGIPEVRGDPITDISALSGLTKLRELWIHGHAITNLDALAGMTDLKRLNAYNNAISDISGLAGLPSIEILTLDSNEIADLSPLGGLATLYGVLLRDNAVTDLTGVEDLPGLREIRLDANPGLSNIQALLDNPGFGGPYPPPPDYDGHDMAGLTSTGVSCADVALLEAKDVLVDSDCP
jgi:hypothetical protein